MADCASAPAAAPATNLSPGDSETEEDEGGDPESDDEDDRTELTARLMRSLNVSLSAVSGAILRTLAPLPRKKARGVPSESMERRPSRIVMALAESLTWKRVETDGERESRG